MLNFEQVKLLEAKVARAIEYVERINGEKNVMLQREAELKGRLESYQKQETELKAKLESYQSRIDELEVLVTRFKKDQGKIEESVLSALDRLNQFERDIEKSLKDKPIGDEGTVPQSAAPPAEEQDPQMRTEISEFENASNPGDEAGERNDEAWKDVADPLVDAPEAEPLDVADGDDDSDTKGGELDIF